MKKLNRSRWYQRLVRVLLGPLEQVPFEQRLLVVGCFSVAVVALVATVSNFMLGLVGLSVITMCLSLCSFSGFLMLRFGNYSRKVALFVGAVAFVYYNVAWFFNFGSTGPTLLSFISIYIFFTLVWRRERLVWLFLLGFLNLLMFYLVERYFHYFGETYQTPAQRVDDIYSTLAFVLGIVFILTAYIKWNYWEQYQKAKRSDELKTAFLANLSHEIRTPLNAVVGFSSILGQELLPKEDVAPINRILTINSKQLLFLIEDIIDLSKLELEQLSLLKSDIHLVRFFKQLSDEFNFLVPDEKRTAILFRYELAVSAQTLYGDRQRIEQVLRILLLNALQYSEKGLIFLKLEEKENNWEFSVTDEGKGIKPELQATIFDMFVKHRQSKDVHERGVGMGLYLGRRLVELMGGKISVASLEGQGSEFRFVLPKETA